MGLNFEDRFEVAFREIAVSSEPNFKLALGRLSSDLATRLAVGSIASTDFFRSSLRALMRVRGTSHAELRLACLYDCMRFFFLNGRSGDALDAADALHKLAIQTVNSAWVRRAEVSRGVVFAESGRIGEAVLRYAKALDTAPADCAPVAMASILINLGVALNYGSLYREAIPCLLRAQELARDEGQPDLEAAALCNLAQSYWYLDEHAKGFEAIEWCLSKSDVPENSPDSFTRTVREFTYVQLALELGELTKARDHSAICYGFAQKAGTQRAHFLAEICSGLCEIYGGTVEHGLKQLEEALGSTLAANAGMFRSVALVALVKGYEEAARPDQALHHMNELMKYARSTRENGLFALNSIPQHYDQSLVKEDQDLRSLGFREARLRARVAERSLEDANREMLERLAVTADLREDISGEHGYRVGALAALVASELGWSKNECETLELAARLHDIGKVGIADRILLSTQELKDAEREFIGTHTVIGAELLGKSSVPHLRVAEAVARCHHEWWNGQGYPSKIRGRRIPIHARIVAPCDVFDALTHGRPYASAWPFEIALNEIAAKRGTQFDPQIVDVVLIVLTQLRKTHSNLDAFLARASKASPLLQAREKIRRVMAKEREGQLSPAAKTTFP